MDHYFIVGPVQIIALDLAYSIRAFDPTAQVDCFHTSEDAIAVVEVTRPAAVLVHREIAGFQSTPLGRALEVRGIPYAFLGSMSGARPDGAIILDSPFSDATVAALLQDLLGRRQVSVQG